MEFEFDPAKDASNVKKHRMSLAAGADRDLGKALVLADLRFDYGEARYTAIGPVDEPVMRDVLHDARGGAAGHQHSPGECPGKEAL